jgi:NAD(P)-dependent dehydrogenase (short-subunit alcohol dehydrogenase family)
MSIEIDLDGQTAIITGAGTGIGRAVAKQYAEAGANVVLAARTESEIQETADLARDRGVQALAVPTDLTQPRDIDSLVEETVEEFGSPQVLVNNAAANLTDSLLDQPLTDVNTMLNVNFRGLFLLSQRFGQAARSGAVERGRIVNISSIGAHLGISRLGIYNATKAGVNGLTRGLAAELSSDGITVNSVSPGLTRSERIEAKLETHSDNVFDIDCIPLGRIAETEDIADVCVFLASDLARYITGEEILVDGGVSFTAGLYK